jgi:hypothetical protein
VRSCNLTFLCLSILLRTRFHVYDHRISYDMCVSVQLCLRRTETRPWSGRADTNVTKLGNVTKRSGRMSITRGPATVTQKPVTELQGPGVIRFAGCQWSLSIVLRSLV